MSSTRRIGPALAVALAACAANPAPRGWLQPASAEAAAAFGAWAVVNQEVAGELVAVATDSLYLMVEPGGLTAVARDTIRTLRLAGYASQAGQLSAWTTVGTVATLSNGFLLVLSAPVWILTGSLLTAGQSRAPIHDYRAARGARAPDEDWAALRAFARFPQGLPEGLPPGNLRPRLQRR
jgi:hypothetical protein